MRVRRGPSRGTWWGVGLCSPGPSGLPERRGGTLELRAGPRLRDSREGGYRVTPGAGALPASPQHGALAHAVRKPWLLQVPTLHALHCSAWWPRPVVAGPPREPPRAFTPPSIRTVRGCGADGSRQGFSEARWPVCAPEGGFPCLPGARSPRPGPRGSVCWPSPSCLELGAGCPEACLGSLSSQTTGESPSG